MTKYKAQLIEITPSKTYATRANAIKAVEKAIGHYEYERAQTYFIATHTDGRFFPVFIGERALHGLIHFKFNVVA
jgi:hypothetical protein